MPRGTKRKQAVTEVKDSTPRDKSRSGDIKIADLFRMIPEGFEKQKKKFQEINSHFEDFKEEIKDSYPHPETDLGLVISNC